MKESNFTSQTEIAKKLNSSARDRSRQENKLKDVAFFHTTVALEREATHQNLRGLPGAKSEERELWELAVEAGKYEEAEQILRSSTCEDSDKLSQYWAYYNLALIYRTKLHKYEEASSCINQAIELLKNNAHELELSDRAIKEHTSHCYVEKSKLYSLKNEVEEAENALNDALRICDYNYVAINSLGVLKERLGKLDAALNCYIQAAKIAKGGEVIYDTAYHNWGNLLMLDGKYCILSASAASEGEASNHKKKAIGNFQFGIKLVDKAIGECPFNPLYYLTRGRLYQLLNEYAQAHSDFSKALTLSPSKDIKKALLLSLSLNYLLQGDKTTALERLGEMASFGQISLAQQNSKGMLYLMAEKPLQAIDCLKEVVDRSKSVPQEGAATTAFNLASAYYQAQDYTQTLDALDIFFNSNGSKQKNILFHAYSLVGSCMSVFGYYEEAKSAYEVSLKYAVLDTEKQEIYVYLGNIFHDMGRYTESLEKYEQAKRIAADDEKLNLINELIESTKQVMEDGEEAIPLARANQIKKLVLKDEFEEDLIASLEEMSIHSARMMDTNVSFDNDETIFYSVIPDSVNKKGKKFYLKKSDTDGKWYKYTRGFAGEYTSPKLANTGGFANFVVLKQESEEKYKIVFGNIGHFHLAGGKGVVYAGKICLKNGEIGHWNNCSGHYKPASLSFVAKDVAEKTGLPLERYASREVIWKRVSKLNEQCNNNMKKITQELKQVTLADKNNTKSLMKDLKIQ